MLALILALIFSGIAPISSAHAQAPAAQNAASRPVGTVKAISGNAVTMTTDAGAELTVNVQDSTRLIKTAPGQKDLTGATAIQLKDLQVGDRILVRGTPSDRFQIHSRQRDHRNEKIRHRAKASRRARRLAKARRGRSGNRGRSSVGHHHNFISSPERQQKRRNPHVKGNRNPPLRSRFHKIR